MPNNDKKTVIGKISYTNAWPLFYHVDTDRLPFEAEITSAVPAVLNQGMQQGNIHIGALSSFAYGEAADKLLLLPDLSVSSDGEVNSILLFSRKPLEQLGRSVIALTNTSATSVNLLKILMHKALGGSPQYLTLEPDLDSMMQSADAALLIGDHAIKASWYNEQYIVTDLGRWWKEWSGHPMTYAVWAVNRDAVLQMPWKMSRIARLFIESKQRSEQDLQPIIHEAAARIGGTAEYWDAYFHNLNYNFGLDQQQGLRLYFRYAFELGLLKRDVVPELWIDNMVMQVKE
ncbi:MqnA/MqnD/SBP family protein [Paenibacillus lemnae]|uniref:Chorismate dehydratase n=1 Tax=Paenibacillus lemnae TaxID=1330551 RepID=A0A848MA71_PAELE|nr:menaquinone biosynthesis protein [Paenibacillus lemnae]